MTISQAVIDNLLTWAITGLLGLLVSLLLLVWRQLVSKIELIDTRLRTLGHEDRDIRSQLSGVMDALLEHVSATKNSGLKEENMRLKWMVESLQGQKKRD